MQNYNNYSIIIISIINLITILLNSLKQSVKAEVEHLNAQGTRVGSEYPKGN